ncbi:MAG: YdjY domain-containing protein [Verrucomicrobiota bacterium]
MKTAHLAAALWLGAGLAGAQDTAPAEVAPARLPADAAHVPARPVDSPKPVAPPKPMEGSLEALTNASLRMVEPGIFDVGKVRLDQGRRHISFPAVLNQDHGPMEYFLVTTYGKTHESILKTEAEPYHIHLAMLLLGAQPAGNGAFPGSPSNGVPGPIVHPSSETIPGSKVALGVHWRQDGAAVNRTAEELVFNTNTQSALGHGFWVYNGSIINRNRFLAQMDGSIVSLVTDPVALVNNIAQGHDNDLIWTANTNNLPPANVPVEVTITLEDAKPLP